MSNREEPDGGAQLLSRLSNEMVRAQKEFFGKGPTEAKSYIVDDLLFIVMRGGLTTAEKTMIEFGQLDLVREFRQIFENEMTERLCGMVAEVTGRKVLTYQSQVMFDPNIVVEMFVLERRAQQEARDATAAGQTDDPAVGAATDREALDAAPESSGRS